ncbi:hypothetical protein SS50377_21289 [Spironucleus salmonicida]|uniref:Uncharacterized protein n=1 Tax=Spironucleus salmonicida TaxID=348837 RepID=A0A9P8M0H2_9EUKA|nr:hypothetical protein SS50377_21289 [Spironucleus salmonicida]
MWQGIIYKNQCIILCKCLFVKRVLLYFVYILKNELCSESLRKGKSFINEYRKICRRWECTVTCLWSLVCSLAGKSQCITVIGGIILKKIGGVECSELYGKISCDELVEYAVSLVK